MRSFDVVIIGGGVVGLTLALSLAKERFSVAVIESQGLQHLSDIDLTSYDSRVFALGLGAKSVFQGLGLSDALKGLRTSAYHSMKVWDAAAHGMIAFDAESCGMHSLGDIIEQKVLLKVLVDAVKTTSEITVFEHAKIVQIEDEQGWVTLEGGEKLAGLLVGADGANSWVRKTLGFHVKRRSYEQSAFVTTLHCEKPHHQIAYQWFHPTGPVALLPLSDPHKVSLVWTLSNKLVETMLHDLNSFDKTLSRLTDYYLGALKSQDKPMSFPLQSLQASKYWKHRCVLVGDAAHVVHPLAGQGMNLGLLDAAYLTKMLVEWRAYRHAPLSRWLNKYERHQKANSVLVSRTMDLFYHGFGSTNVNMITLRNFGLKQVSRMPWLKNRLIAFASGKRETSVPTL